AASLKQAVLLHQPLGDEHPYLAGPTERTPRYPLAGEAVTLGIRASTQVQTVAVRWILNDTPQEPIQAQRISDSGELWQAKLPPLEDGAQVAYWLEDQDTNTQGPFTYRVVGWQADPQSSIGWQAIKPGVWEGRVIQAASSALEEPETAPAAL